MRWLLGVMWLLRLLPLWCLDALGALAGELLFRLGGERRRVGQINLQLCFDAWSAAERRRLLRRHYHAFVRALLHYGVLWWSRPARLDQLVHILGGEHLPKDQPCILLVPHFVGLDVGWSRLTRDREMVSIYSQQKSAAFGRLLLRGRERFGRVQLFSRQQGIRPIVAALRRGLPFYYLPDQDFGRKDAMFVPFFGVAAATITGLSRLARATDAQVVPCIIRQGGWGQPYQLQLYPAWTNFPTADMAADTRRMNAFIEERILEHPEHYFWLHKRFKTRPEGQPRIY